MRRSCALGEVVEGDLVGAACGAKGGGDWSVELGEAGLEDAVVGARDEYGVPQPDVG
jgi:hypothetical protein